MQLKLNLPVPKTSTAVNYYKSLFGGEILKEGINDGHSYIKIFDKISIHLHSIGKIAQNSAYLIIRFDINENDTYLKTINNLQNRVDIEITTFDKEMIWNTRMTEFIDKYGYKWVLEIGQ